MKLIIAGNHDQFTWYCQCKKLHPTEARYISRYSDIFGHNQDVEIILTGTYYEGSFYKELISRGILWSDMAIRFSNIKEDLDA